MNIVVKNLKGITPYEEEVEIVERKGTGHPDTICDNVAEQVSIEISKLYLDEFGMVMHHNVDKALLIGGVADPRFGGGKIIEPIELTVVGRATKEIDGHKVEVDEVAIEAIKNWLKRNIANLNVEAHIIPGVKIRPGSKDLVDLFRRFGKGEVPLANDTSFGTGFYPFDELEQAVYEAERLLNNKELRRSMPFIGEDIKVMGVRNGNTYKLTVAMATVDRFISDLEDYIEKKEKVKELLLKKIKVDGDLEIFVNTADDMKTGSVYLTVTGTSAEQGDDGQVGRGNRINGLITPYRPMSLEAAAGKNAVSHVGKIYNFFAQDLSKAIVEEGLADESYVYIVSQIGKPINQPQVLDIRVKNTNEETKIKRLAEELLQEMPEIWKKVIEGKYNVA